MMNVFPLHYFLKVSGCIFMAAILAGGTAILAADGRVFYLSPTGSDSNFGTSPASPWKTFAFAIPRLQPGDRLILKNGTYTGSNTGYPKIICGQNASSGEPGRPITITAEAERQAFLDGDGSARPFYMRDCSHWNVEGLRAEGGDFSFESGDEMGSVFVVKNSSYITVKRSLGEKPNRYKNAHVFNIIRSSHILLEENEAYTFHRHGFSIFRSDSITVRRNYAHSRSYANLAGGYNSKEKYHGDEGLTFYWSDHSIMENSISERNEQIGNTGSYNLFIGNISLGDSFCFSVGHHPSGGPEPTQNLYIDNVAINCVGNGVHSRSPTSVIIRNMTAINCGKAGFWSDNGFSSDNNSQYTWDIDPDVTVQNMLAVNSSTGFVVTNSDQFRRLELDYLNAYNNNVNYGNGTESRKNSTEINPELGSCMVFIPENSPMKGIAKDGADIGANILYRSQDGNLTSQPLWDLTSGAFPCGTIVQGVNDKPDSSCFDVHKRLNVNTNGCSLPSGLDDSNQTPVPPENLRILSSSS